MEPSDDELTPQDVDAQIAWLARYVQEGDLEDNKNAQLVQRLQRYYQKQKQQQVLGQAWKSIAQKYDAGMPSPIDEGQTRHKQQRKESSNHALREQQRLSIKSTHSTLHHVSTLLAVAVLLFMIGTTAVIMSRVAQQNSGPASGGGHSPACTATSTPVATPSTITPRSTVTPVGAIPTRTPQSTSVGCPTPLPTQPPAANPTPLPTQLPAANPTPLPT